MCLKESQKREDELKQTVDLLAVTRKGKGRKEKLEDCFDAWVRSCDEVKVTQTHKRFIGKELKQCFGRYKASWKSTERKTEVVAEKA